MQMIPGALPKAGGLYDQDPEDIRNLKWVTMSMAERRQLDEGTKNSLSGLKNRNKPSVPSVDVPMPPIRRR